MPVFNSEDEAVKAHEGYHIDTDREGKFVPTHNGWLRTKQLMDWIPDTKPLVIGIGCNSGGLERTILRHKKGSIVYGVDVNPELVNLACQKGIIAKVARAESLPFKDEYFDVAILSEILEHVFDVSKVLGEAKRVLKNGGLVIGSVPHPDGRNAQKGTEHHAYHTRIFDGKQLRKDLSKHFKDVKTENIYFSFDPKAPSYVYKNPQWIAFKGTK
jgi:2-polyprenyl-3-methyl-5-hydroxy-6-metoxy-1,4-benzoquinol methylase